MILSHILLMAEMLGTYTDKTPLDFLASLTENTS